MPIFKEINNINLFPMWKLQNNYGAATGEASEYIRKIGEHFVSFIHKLDQSEVLANNKDSSDFWISLLGTFLVNTLSQKYLKINSFSQAAEKQLLTDLAYFRKLISQFITTTFEIFDTLTLGMSVTKKEAETAKTVGELIETHKAQLGGLFAGIDHPEKINFNEMILRAM